MLQNLKSKRWVSPSLGGVLLIFIFQPPLLAAAMPTTPIRLAGRTLVAEVAKTAETRAIGYSWREQIALNQGMLFVFEENGIHCMWMKNALVPLTAVYISSTHRIIGSERMHPLTEERHCSPVPVRFILELPSQGYDETDLPQGMLVDFNLDKRKVPK